MDFLLAVVCPVFLARTATGPGGYGADGGYCGGGGGDCFVGGGCCDGGYGGNGGGAGGDVGGGPGWDLHAKRQYITRPRSEPK